MLSHIRTDHLLQLRLKRGLIAAGAMFLVTGCFPGAAERDQGIIVADIAGETEEE